MKSATDVPLIYLLSTYPSPLLHVPLMQGDFATDGIGPGGRWMTREVSYLLWLCNSCQSLCLDLGARHRGTV